MALQATYPRFIKSVEYASMTSLLIDFRRQLEHTSGGPIQELDNANAAMILSDLCVFLGLSDQNRRRVLGARAATFIDSLMLETVETTIKH